MNYQVIPTINEGDGLARVFLEQQQTKVAKRRETRHKLRVFRRVITEVTALIAAAAIWCASASIALYFIYEAINILCPV